MIYLPKITIPKIIKKADPFLFLAMILLLVFGLTVILSTNREAFGRQIIFALTGLLLYFAVAALDYRLLRFASTGLYLAVLGLLGLVLVSGVVTRGAVRWLEVVGQQFQPSEFSKVALILLLATLLRNRIRMVSFKIFLLSLFLTVVPVILVYFQPDLGTSIILLAIWLGIVVAAGLKPVYLFLMLAGGLGLLVPLWSLLKDYQRRRLINFFNPTHDPLGGGYNVLQSTIAVGSGQIWGRGFGRGTQSHLQFLPEHHTDFIFASLSEEWGFVGAILLLGFFAVLLIRILMVAREAGDGFGQLITIGVFSFLLPQIFINVGMNLGIMPITGIPLPLVSYGGSSLWVTMLALGLVQSVAIRRRK
jgi:rod shape determining protein RodA